MTQDANCHLSSDADESEEQDLATKVMAMMKKDENKLCQQAKRLVRKQRALARRVFSVDIDGWTPIHACVLRASKKLLKIMLSAQVDVNLKMGTPEGLPVGCSLLHIAAHRGDIKIMDYLVSHGADLNQEDSNGHTPIIYAARAEHYFVLRHFEEKGVYFRESGKTLYEVPETEQCETPQPSATKFCFH